ncbi:ABC transporter permease [Prauserella cavernicola]|uniref:ABC transporter permease n=1 Tax=Prauserella cavernicola TaxID=2800127 RepID=A0A934QXN3_9PSEU|nr:ABC transporter permease [Prauserella cavernicola]MBK1787178.1 ABC transporter permease [Prauserella cavernicola]
MTAELGSPPTADTRTAPTRTPSTISRLRHALTDGAVIIRLVTVLIFVVASIAVPQFATGENFQTLLQSVALIGIAAVGLSLITIVGRLFSLSVSATIAISAILFAATLRWGPWTALLVSALFGLLSGAVQGVLVGRWRTDPIVTTIAFAAIMLGLGQLFTEGRNIRGDGDATVFGSTVLGIPGQVFAFLLATVVAWWLHRYTVRGRVLSLIGLNEKAALVSGLRSWPIVVLAFGVAGLFAGVAGGLLGAQSGQGNLGLGAAFGFDAITAVVVGGVSVKGGRGSPFDAAVGALLVGLLGNVLILAGLSYETQLIVKGVLVLGAVVLAGATALDPTTRRGGR